MGFFVLEFSCYPFHRVFHKSNVSVIDKQNILKVLVAAGTTKKSGFITSGDMTRDITSFLCLLP